MVSLEELLARVNQAETEADRQWILLELQLSQMPEDLVSMLWAAAVPHWFDGAILAALRPELAERAEELYGQLQELTFVEEFAGRGHNVHELTRDVLLGKLWAEQRGEFLELSRRAADYFFGLDGDGDAEVEACYHEVLYEGEAQTGRLLDRAIDWWTYRRLDLLQSTIQRLEEHQKSQRLDHFGDGFLQHLLGLQEMLSARYKRAGQYFERGREYYDEAAIIGDRYYAALLRDLANSYYDRADYTAAEPLFQRALDICERQLGADHPHTAFSFGNLAQLHTQQKRYADAEIGLLKALQIFMSAFNNPQHPYVTETVRRIQNLVAAAINDGRTAELSDHPLTQQLLAQLRTNER